MNHIPPPMNGTKTRPLGAIAISTLRELLRGPMPAQEINSGIVNRLSRGDLTSPFIALEPGPSPYKTRKGSVMYAHITDAGRQFIAALS